jgi:curved DNA-binding protein CbpA
VTDLYAVIGVARDASAAKIKAAYRRKSKAAHPDTGGSEEAFAALAQAYEVLSDPERRAKYDATGEIDTASALNAEAKVFACINRVLAQVLGHEQDYLTYDLIGLMGETLANEIKAQKNILAMIEKVAKRAKRMQGRFKRKEPGDDNLLERMVAWHLANTVKGGNDIEGEIALRERAIVVLKDYRFDPEEAVRIIQWGSFAGSALGTTG